MTQENKDALIDRTYSIRLRNGMVVEGARLSGRLADFPRMRYEDRTTGLSVDVEVAWSTVQRLADTGNPLRL